MAEKIRPTYSRRDGQLGFGAGLTDLMAMDGDVLVEQLNVPKVEVEVNVKLEETPKRLPWEKKGEGMFVNLP